MKVINIWKYVLKEKECTYLGNNPSKKQKKAFEEECLIRLKALSCLSKAFSNEIFFRVVDFDTTKKV